MIALLFLLIQLFLAGFFLYLCIAFMTGGPFVPTRNSSVDAMIRVAGIRNGMTVVDLGSGDGRVLLAAAREGAYAVGFEINPYLVWYTRLRAFLSPQRGMISVYWKNLWRADISRADIVFVYLIPWRMKELAGILNRQLKPGSLVISNSFIFPDWKVIRKDTVNHIYVYRL